jgi:hypothetical protein
MKQLTRYNISLLLTILAVLLWALSILQSKLTIDNYGLISSFPSIFFISLTVLVIASALLWTTREKHTFILISQTILLIVSLYLTPYLLEGTARMQAAYQNYGFSDYIISTGSFNPKIIWYHSYPAFPILFAVFFKITGIVNPEFIVAIFPTIMMLLYLLPLQIIMSNTDAKIHNGIYAAFWIFSIANWTSQEYYSPQSIAFYILIMIIALMSRRWATGNYQIAHVIILVILSSALSIMHTVTSIICLGAVIAVFIIWRFNNYTYVILFATIISAWTIFGAFFLLGSLLPRFISEAFNADALSYATFFLRFVETSPEHTFINQLRVIFTFIFMAIALLGFMLQRRGGRLSRVNFSILAITYPAIIMLPVFVYSGEFIIRVWLMLLLPVAYFSIILVRKRLTYILLIIIIIVGIPVSMMARYGNEVFDYTYPNDVKFTEFFYSNVSGGRVLGMMPPVAYKGLDKYAYYFYWSATNIPEYTNSVDIVNVKPDQWKIQYVGISNRLKALYTFWLAKPDQFTEIIQYLNMAVQYNLVYSNNGADLYVWEEPCSSVLNIDRVK